MITLKNVKVFNPDGKSFQTYKRFELDSQYDIDEEHLEGGYLIPSLTDIHTHSDFYLDSQQANNYAKNMGVEVQVGGLCGFHSVFDETKVSRGSYEEFASFLGTKTSIFNSFDQLFHKIKVTGKKHMQLFGVNSYLFSYPITEETNLEQYVQQFNDIYQKYPFSGISVGLSYHPIKSLDPAIFTRFMKILLQTIPTVYSYHLRNQNMFIFEALDEVFEYHRGSAAHCHISHLKFSGATHMGQVKQRYQQLEEMTEKESFNITWDAYPFNFACTTVSSFLPESDSWSKMSLEKAVAYLKENPPFDFENIVIACADARYNGFILSDIAQREGLDVEVAYFKVVNDLLGIGTYFRKFATLDDLNVLIYDEKVLIASDSLGVDNVHPRCTHTYSKVLASAYDRGEKEFTAMVDKLVNGPKTVFADFPASEKKLYLKFNDSLAVNLGSSEQEIDNKFVAFSLI